jgi:putative DNA primase/helicase
MASDNDMELVPVSGWPEEKTEWLLRPFIPFGYVTMLSGFSEVGKSTFMIDLIGRLTRAYPMPKFGDQPARRIDGSVVILCKEDPVGGMIRPRLRMADADLERVHMPVLRQQRFRTFREHIHSLDGQVESLEREIKKIGDVRLIFIDPIMSFVGKAGAYAPDKVRDLMAPISRLAERHKIAIVCTLHMSKGLGRRGVDRMQGSGAFVQVARSKIFVVKADDRSNTRLLVSAGSNIMRVKKNAVEFDIVETETDHPEIKWANDLEEISGEKFNKLLDGKTAHVGKRALAAEMLEELLADGPVSAREVEREAGEAGIGMNTVEAAKKDLGVRSVHRGDGSWWWEFPPKPAKQEAKKPKDPRPLNIVPGGLKRFRA